MHAAASSSALCVFFENLLFRLITLLIIVTTGIFFYLALLGYFLSLTKGQWDETPLYFQSNLFFKKPHEIHLAFHSYVPQRDVQGVLYKYVINKGKIARSNFHFKLVQIQHKENHHLDGDHALRALYQQLILVQKLSCKQ